MNRGDVWLALPDTGAASAEPQPCVVLSPAEIHDYLGLITVAPVTQGGASAAYRVPCKIAERTALIRLEQIRTVEKHALTRQVGALDDKTLALALAKLREMFAD